MKKKARKTTPKPTAAQLQREVDRLNAQSKRRAAKQLPPTPAA